MERRVFLIDGLWVLIVDFMGGRNVERESGEESFFYFWVMGFDRGLYEWKKCRERKWRGEFFYLWVMDFDRGRLACEKSRKRVERGVF